MLFDFQFVLLGDGGNAPLPLLLVPDGSPGREQPVLVALGQHQVGVSQRPPLVQLRDGVLLEEHEGALPGLGPHVAEDHLVEHLVAVDLLQSRTEYPASHVQQQSLELLQFRELALQPSLFLLAVQRDLVYR